MILLCSLSTSYILFRDTILYSHNNFTIEEVYDVLFPKEKMNNPFGYEGQWEALLFMVVMRGVDWNLISIIRFINIARRSGTLKRIAISCKIKKNWLQIRTKGNKNFRWNQCCRELFEWGRTFDYFWWRFQT